MKHLNHFIRVSVVIISAMILIFTDKAIAQTPVEDVSVILQEKLESAEETSLVDTQDADDTTILLDKATWKAGISEIIRTFYLVIGIATTSIILILCLVGCIITKVLSNKGCCARKEEDMPNKPKTLITQ